MIKRIYLIASREYNENVKTKGFWIGSLLIPILMAGFVAMMALLSQQSSSKYFVLLDQSGQYHDIITTAMARNHQKQVMRDFINYYQNQRHANAEQQQTAQLNQLLAHAKHNNTAALSLWLEKGGLRYWQDLSKNLILPQAPPFKAPTARFVEVPLPENVKGTNQQQLEALKPFLNNQQKLLHKGQSISLYAAVVLPQNLEQAVVRVNQQNNNAEYNRIEYWSIHLNDTSLANEIEAIIRQYVHQLEYAKLGVDKNLIEQVNQSYVPITHLDSRKQLGDEEVAMSDRLERAVPVIFALIMFTVLFGSQQHLLTSMIEEKSSRVIEVLLGSVTPSELMTGKLIGIALSLLTLVATWIITTLLILNLGIFKSSGNSILTQLLDVLVNSPTIPLFLFYLMAGYLLYAGFFLAVGSLCDTIKEAQNLQTPAVLLLVLPIMTMKLVIQDPHGTLAVVMSWFPPTTPFVMMVRVSAGANTTEVLASAVLLIISIAIMLSFTSKAFKLGVLRSGQPPKLTELYRMIKNART